MSQPRHCRSTAPASGTGSLSTASPCRPMTRSWRTEPMPSLTTGRWCRLAPSQAIVKSANPTSAAMPNETTAQCGTSAVSSTQTTRIVAGTRSKSRCAKTVPTSVALVPGGASGR